MEREQEEMQSLGLFGIYSESAKLIFKLRKIFAQITLTLILPLSIIFLAQQKISDTLYHKLRFHEFVLSDTPLGTPQHHKLSDLVSSEWALYALLKASYFTFLLIFSLLSTSAVVYAIACAYTSREIKFKNVIISVVPRVWKRLMVTFLCALATFVGYNLVFTCTIFLWDRLAYDSPSTFDVVVLCAVLVVYAVGFVYVTVVWQVASVVTVLEEGACGFRAMVKGRSLIKGKLAVAIVIFLKVNVCLVVIDVFFKACVVYGDGSVVEVVGFGVLFVLLLLVLILFVLVVQTVLYFVCKSYHRESIDKSALSEHLEGYLGDYVPLIGTKDVQMKEYVDDDDRV